DKLYQEGKFDFQKLDKYKIPTIEYAGKRPESAILAQAILVGEAAPLQVVRAFGNGHNDPWRNMIVQGDNLQFLKTCYLNQDPLIKDKVKGKVKLIYIDPPFGTGDEYGGADGEMSYSAKLMGAEYVETLRERLIYLRELLNDDGSIFIRLDYHFGHYMKVITDEIFGRNNFRNEIIVRRGQSKAGFFKQFDKINSLGVDYDNIFWYSKNANKRFAKIKKEAPEFTQKYGKWMNLIKAKAYDRPTMKYELLGIIKDAPWMWSKERAFKAVENFKKYQELTKTKEISLEYFWEETGQSLEFVRRKGNQIQYWIPPRESILVDNNWLDIKGYSHLTNYPTENSEELLERIIQVTSKDDLVLDCFAGSGTTGAVAEKLGRRWIMCDFGKHSIYTMQKRIWQIAESKKLEQEAKNNVKYRQPPQPFSIISAGVYDFSRIMNLRKNKEAYINFVLGLFSIMQEEKDYISKYKLSNIYAEKDNNPVEVYPIWDDVYLKEVRIDEDYLKEIVRATGGRLKGDYYIVTPESCTVITNTTLKNGNNEDIDFKLLKFPYKVLEDVSRHFQIKDQPASAGDINKLISSVGFYFNEEIEIAIEKIPEGFRIKHFSSGILNQNKERYEGLEGLSMILIDKNYDGQAFNLSQAIYKNEITYEGIIKIEGLAKDSYLIAIDKHGNESKVIKI
ncbi:MAG: site-specific DNA-methyltransferase, partial [Actinobacteria bacterium]|nr:site-specific DNA-methyltransferase [Actinomycetota bacterium]